MKFKYLFFLSVVLSLNLLYSQIKGECVLQTIDEPQKTLDVAITSKYGCVKIFLASAKIQKITATKSAPTDQFNIYFGAPNIPHDHSKNMLEPTKDSFVYTFEDSIYDSQESIYIGIETSTDVATVKIVVNVEEYNGDALVCNDQKKLIQTEKYITCLPINKIVAPKILKRSGEVYEKVDVELKTDSYNYILLDAVTSSTNPGSFYVIPNQYDPANVFYISTNCQTGKTFVPEPTEQSNSWIYIPKSNEMTFQQNADTAQSCKFSLGQIFQGVESTFVDTYKFSFYFYVNEKFDIEYHDVEVEIELNAWWKRQQYYQRFIQMDIKALSSNDNVESYEVTVAPFTPMEMNQLTYSGETETTCNDIYFPAKCQVAKKNNKYTWKILPTNTKLYLGLNLRPGTAQTVMFRTYYEVTCKANYKFSLIEKSCKQLIQNCDSYSDDLSKCTACKAGFKLAENDKVCIPEIPTFVQITGDTQQVELANDLNFFQVNIKPDQVGQIIQVYFNSTGQMPEFTFYAIADCICDAPLADNVPTSSNNCYLSKNQFQLLVEEKCQNNQLYIGIEMHDFYKTNAFVQIQFSRKSPLIFDKTQLISLQYVVKQEPIFIKINLKSYKKVQQITLTPKTSCLLNRDFFLGAQNEELNQNYLFPDAKHSIYRFYNNNGISVYFADDVLTVGIDTQLCHSQVYLDFQLDITELVDPSTITCDHASYLEDNAKYYTCIEPKIIDLEPKTLDNNKFFEDSIYLAPRTITIIRAHIGADFSLVPGAFYITYNKKVPKNIYISSDCILESENPDVPYTYYDIPSHVDDNYNFKLDTENDEVSFKISKRVFTAPIQFCSLAISVDTMDATDADSELYLQFVPFFVFTTPKRIITYVPWKKISIEKLYTFDYSKYASTDIESLKISIVNKDKNTVTSVEYSYPSGTGNCGGMFPKVKPECAFPKTTQAEIDQFDFPLTIDNKQINLFVYTRNFQDNIENISFDVKLDIKCKQTNFVYSAIYEKCIPKISNCIIMSTDGQTCLECEAHYKQWNKNAACIPNLQEDLTTASSYVIKGQHNFFKIYPNQIEKTTIVYIKLNQPVGFNLQAEYYISCNSEYPSKDNNCGAFLPGAHDGMYLKIDSETTSTILFAAVVNGIYYHSNQNSNSIMFQITREKVEEFTESSEITMPVNLRTEPIFLLINLRQEQAFQKITLKTKDDKLLPQNIDFISKHLIPKGKKTYSIMTEDLKGQWFIAKKAIILVVLNPQFLGDSLALDLQIAPYDEAEEFTCPVSMKKVKNIDFITCVIPEIKILESKIIFDKYTGNKQYYWDYDLEAAKQTFTIYRIKNFQTKIQNDVITNEIERGTFYLVSPSKDNFDKMIISTNCNQVCAQNYAEIPGKENECTSLIKSQNELVYDKINVQSTECYIQFAVDLLDLSVESNQPVKIMAYPQFIINERFLDEKLNITIRVPWSQEITAPVYFEFNISEKFSDIDNIDDIVLKLIDFSFNVENKLYIGVDSINAKCQYDFPDATHTCDTSKTLPDGYEVSLKNTLQTQISVTLLKKIILTYQVSGVSSGLKNIQINYNVLCKNPNLYYDDITNQCEERIFHCLKYKQDYLTCEKCAEQYTLSENKQNCFPTNIQPIDISEDDQVEIDLYENYYSIKMSELENFSILYAKVSDSSLQVDYYLQCIDQKTIPTKTNNCNSKLGYIIDKESKGLSLPITEQLKAQYKEIKFIAYIYRPKITTNSHLQLIITKYNNIEFTLSGNYTLQQQALGQPIYFQVKVDAKEIQEVAIMSPRFEILKPQYIYFSSSKIPRTNTKFPNMTNKLNSWFTLNDDGYINGQKINIAEGIIYVAIYPEVFPGIDRVQIEVLITPLINTGGLYCSQTTQVKLTHKDYIACVDALITTLVPKDYPNHQEYYQQTIHAQNNEYNVFRIIAQNIPQAPETNSIPGALYLINEYKEVKGKRIFITSNCNTKCALKLGKNDNYTIPSEEFNCWDLRKDEPENQETVFFKKLEQSIEESECVINIAIDLLQNAPAPIYYVIKVDPFLKIQDYFQITHIQVPKILWGEKDAQPIYYEVDLELALKDIENVEDVFTEIHVNKQLVKGENIFIKVPNNNDIFPTELNTETITVAGNIYSFKTAPKYRYFYMAYIRYGRTETQDPNYFIKFDVECKPNFVFSKTLKTCTLKENIIDHCIQQEHPGQCLFCEEHYKLSAQANACVLYEDVTSYHHIYEPSEQTYWSYDLIPKDKSFYTLKLDIKQNDVYGILYIENLKGFTDAPMYINTNCAKQEGELKQGIPDRKYYWQMYNKGDTLKYFEMDKHDITQCEIYVSIDFTVVMQPVKFIYLPFLRVTEHVETMKYNTFTPWDSTSNGPFYFELDNTQIIKNMNFVKNLAIEITGVKAELVNTIYVGSSQDGSCYNEFPKKDTTQQLCRVQSNTDDGLKYFTFSVSNKATNIYINFDIQRSIKFDTTNFQISTNVICENDYYFSNKTKICIKKPDVCDAGYCSICEDDDPNACIECISPSAYELINGKCYDKRKLVNHCNVYDNDIEQVTCLECHNGFKINAMGNMCEAICNVANCDICFDNEHCQICAAPYQISKDQHICLAEPCEINNCITCADDDTCAACSKGYTLAADKKSCSSVKCTSGYYFDLYYKQCIRCISHCSQCTSRTDCSRCQMDYSLFTTPDGQYQCKENFSKLMMPMFLLLLLIFNLF